MAPVSGGHTGARLRKTLDVAGHPVQNRTVFDPVLTIAFPVSIALGVYRMECIWRSGRKK